MPGLLSQPSLTETISELRQAIESFREDLKEGQLNTILAPVDDDADDDTGITFLKPTPIPDDIDAQLDAHEAQLDVFEARLKDREQVQTPGAATSSEASSNVASTYHPSVAVYYLQDLEKAIALLGNAIDSASSSSVYAAISSQPESPPYTFFRSKNWQWDPIWCEFMTNLPTPDHYIYLTQWDFDESTNMMHMAESLEPDLDEAALTLGCWEDWRWDESWHEWYLPIFQEKRDENGVEECQDIERGRIYASEWIINEDGSLEHVNRQGRSDEE